MCVPLAVLSVGSCVLKAWVYGDLLATVDLGNSFECMALKDTLFGGFVFKHKAVYIHYFLDIRNKASDVKRFDEFLKLLHLADHWPFQRTLGQLPIFSPAHSSFRGKSVSPNWVQTPFLQGGWCFIHVTRWEVVKDVFLFRLHWERFSKSEPGVLESSRNIGEGHLAWLTCVCPSRCKHTQVQAQVPRFQYEQEQRPPVQSAKANTNMLPLPWWCRRRSSVASARATTSCTVLFHWLGWHAFS